VTTLSANIDSSQTLLPISGPLTNGTFQYPLYYTVDDEAIRVIGRAHEETWLVDRAIAGTTAASHSSGATLTRYFPDAAGGVGTEQTVRLLGPFTINHDDPGLAGTDDWGTGLVLGEVPDGAYILPPIQVFIDETFSGSSDDDNNGLSIFLAPFDPPAGELSRDNRSVEMWRRSGEAGNFLQHAAGDGAQPGLSPVTLNTPRVVAGQSLMASLFVNGPNPLTQGSARIVIFIAEPA